MDSAFEAMSSQEHLDVTTIKVKLKYPCNHFHLYFLDFCPSSSKVKLAIEYKALAEGGLDYTLQPLNPLTGKSYRELSQATGVSKPPYLVITRKDGFEKKYATDSTEILGILDSDYPSSPLMELVDEKLSMEVKILEDWLDETLKPIYERLLYLNEDNLQLAARAWLRVEEGLFDKAKLYFLRHEKSLQLIGSSQNAEKAYAQAMRRLDEELLPLINNRLELAREYGRPFLHSKKPMASDLTLYAYLFNIMQLFERSLVSQREILMDFMDAIEEIPLNNSSEEADRRYNKRKFMIVGSQAGL